ncbi:MAG: hypothetical protein IPJ23_12125 [Ignavibacteriales bacterium]|nr:hypothetical protein [Ignavibacteriales bacterium]
MRVIQVFLLVSILCSFAFPQSTTKIALIHENSYDLIEAENQTGIIYISLIDLINASSIPVIKNDSSNIITLQFENYLIQFSVNIPFVNILNRKDSSLKTIQLSSPPHRKENKIFVSVLSLVELINLYWDKELIQLAPNRIKIIEKNTVIQAEQNNSVQISSFSISTGEDNTIIKILTTSPVVNPYNFYRAQKLHLILWGTSIKKDSTFLLHSNDIIDKVEVIKSQDYTEFIFSLSESETITEMYKGENESELGIRISIRDFGDWYTRESENFKIIYRDSHSYLVNHLLSSAENSLIGLKKIFNYLPKEKIIINTYDVSDYGFGATTTLPENYIRLEIEPLEPGYEMVPYSERFQWLLSHELVHIVVNDMASDFEGSLRSIFGKVSPDKVQPLTVFYSLLTNQNRYTPRWFQESIAVFIETWFSGGYGRILGSFDEMYFRSLVNEQKKFPSEAEIGIVTSHTSIFLESILYLYGTRFIAHLAEKYGAKKVYDWFSLKQDEFYPGLRSKFEEIFNTDFVSAWEEFVSDEKTFQSNNLELLNKYPITETKALTQEPFGWVTQTTFDKKNNSLIFGYHRSGELAQIQSFDLNTNESTIITTQPSPSLIQVASVAYDESYNHLFFTTNNNQLYRDVWMHDLNSNKENLLFSNVRVGALTISQTTHEFWGIQHISGKDVMVRSKYPYTELQSLTVFKVGDELQDLSINPKGDLLAGTIHQSDGKQSIFISDITGLEKGKPFLFNTITSSGSPENPSWSTDGNFLYWNAYTNGVSNIYRSDIKTGEIIPISNTIIGLFRPVEISKDSIIAMEFSTDGFTPVKFANKKSEKLPAINYFGQKILDKTPELYNLNLKSASEVIDLKSFSKEKSFSSLDNISIRTFIPIVSGFQSRVVLGLYTQLNDALLTHDLIIEAGISPFKETTKDIKFHLRLKYSYKQKFILGIEHNTADFFDLFNKRKRGMLGSRYAIGYNHYWVFDNPLKVKQSTELSFYNGIKFINDNLTEISHPDYAILKSDLDIQNLRRSIGSIDWESGDKIKLSVMGYGSDPKAPKFSGQLMGEWDKYSIFLASHNVLHFKTAVGYHIINEDIPETMFYFGGFGNREIENEPVKQFQKMFRFPGVPIYSIISDKFVKILIENSFPPIRIPNISVASIELKNINFSIFSQGLLSDSPDIDKLVDAGVQINIMLEHWYNLESTVSAGFAKAWWKSGSDTEWFISWKLLRD